VRKPYQSRKADYLLDEIGGIDDRYLTEAMNWQPLRRKKPFARVLPLVASLAAVLLLSFTVLLPTLQRSFDKNESPNVGESLSPSHPSTLDSLLQDCAQSPSFTPCSADALDFFDGNVRLTVCELSTGKLFVSRPLSESEQNALSREFNATGERVTDGATSEESFRVWVLLGDGSVVTPCLSASAGNVGAATLFDYESERIPTKIFNDLLSDLT